MLSALLALHGTRYAVAVTRAFELTGHSDPAVAEAAWDVLAAAC
jgi:hypothetical protein